MEKHKIERLFSIKLWSINRWLRYTGFRIVITLPNDEDDGNSKEWFTKVGLGWWGFKDF